MGKKQNIQNLRNHIDRIDGQIMELLKKRFIISQKIGILKKQKGLKVKQKRREKESLSLRLRKAQQLKMDKSFIQKLFQLIFQQSRHKQRSLTKK